MNRPEVRGQAAMFDMEPPEPPKMPTRREMRGGEVRFVRYTPTRRTLCDDCIRDIHQRGMDVAPPPLTVRWKRITKYVEERICEQHKRASEVRKRC